MSLSTQPYKGARDFYPEDKRLQKYIFKKWRKVVEQFGYEEYDAPILEPLELYLAKTGDEIVNEQSYTFTDRGGRKVAIRPEMTPSVSRMVAAKRQELGYPLRLYSIPNLWRYEQPQRGRLREHWQLNADVFGLSGIEAEHETILMADAIMKSFKAKWDMYTFRVNSLKFMQHVFSGYLGLDDTQMHTLTKLIDQMHKMDKAEFIAKVDGVFSPSQRDSGANEELLELLNLQDINDLPAKLADHSSVNDVRKLLAMLENSGITNAAFDMSIVRGFNYYTDIVFEVFDTDPTNNRSMFGGGRYDGLVGMFGVEPVPTVGFGVGDVTFQNFLQMHGLLPKLKTETDVYVVIIGNVIDKAQEVIADLRDMSINLAVDHSGRKADKQIKSAVKKGIRNVLFIGERELDEDRYVLKDLLTGVEEKHGLHRLVSIIKDYRKR